MNLKGILPDRAVQVIADMDRKMTEVTTQFRALAAKPLVTMPEAQQAFGPAAQREALQVSGSHPLNLTGLIGLSTGVAAGTYTVGLKLTGGGTNGTITIDAQGRISAIQQAT